MKNYGHIELILGPMFSGKSSEMMRKVRRYEHARKSCLVINYLNDNRYSF
jgi:thymidine kinase